jgi:putative peptide zinc metalloprotease protein
MALEQDLGIRELGSLRPRLRGDLVWTPQMSGGQRFYLVEDPLNGKFFRMGTAEYSFVSLLDGEIAIGDALRLMATSSPNTAFTEHEAVTICQWLMDNQLVHTNECPASMISGSENQRDDGPALQRWNPLVLRLPLLHPDRLFNALSRWTNCLFSLWALALWLGLALTAAYHLATEWHRAVTSFAGVFAPANWFWLPFCWFGLKLVHELAHGAACKRFGGAVREAGVILILFLPVTYVDVTSSWRFRSKWHRIITAAAGMYAELLIGGLATLLWSSTNDGLFNSLCFNVVVMASVTTVVFNANCLMRFDGYYMLSDWLEIPNLASVAQQQVTRWALKPFFCAGPAPAALPKSQSKCLLVGFYGLASFLWKIVVCSCMVIAATTMFEGAGKLLALLAAVLWLGVPTLRLLKRIARIRHQGAGTRGLSISSLGLALLLAVVLFVEVPWPLPPQAPTVVQYAPIAVIRADSPGFVSQILVRGGQLVSAGQTLVILRNDELKLELADLERAIAQSEVKVRIYEHGRQLATRQAEAKQLEVLQTKYEDKCQQLKTLEILAPISGRVIGANLSNLAGVYLEPGEEILSIGDEQRKELQVAIAQEMLTAFQASEGQPVRVRLRNGEAFQTVLSSISPRATLECPHTALSGANGGPLPVRAAVADSPDEADSPDGELLVPHFTGTLQLDRVRSSGLRAGQVGRAALPTYREAIGSYLHRALTRWIRKQFRQAEQRTT